MEQCQVIDLKAYHLGEVTPGERGAVEAHVKACPECRAELDRLQLLFAALGSLREEEPPRRIAFVSDKVFEPTWWQRFWASGPRVGFASAALLSGAILLHGLVQQPAPAASAADIDIRVAKAVAVSEKRQQEKVTQILSAIADQMELTNKQATASYVRQTGLVKE